MHLSFLFIRLSDLLCAFACGAVAVLLYAENEGFAVNTLVNGRVLLMGADHYAFESAEVTGVSRVCAL